MSEQSPTRKEKHGPSKALQQALCGLSSQIKARREQQFSVLLDSPEIQQKLTMVRDESSAEMYYDEIGYYLDSIEDLLTEQISENPSVQFLLRHYPFVANHIENLCIAHEGPASVHSKSHHLIMALTRHFIDGSEIEIKEYSKNRVFTSQAQVLEFFHGLVQLYNGKPDLYLTALHSITTAANKLKEQRNAANAARR